MSYALFPSSRVSGCYFHFNQSLYRKICLLGFDKLYKRDGVERETFKRIMAIPFVRAEDMEEAYDLIKQQAPESIEPFLTYFEDTYFAPGCRFDRTMLTTCGNFSLRTTNHVEGWHNAFNRSVGIHHANLWRFIKKLQEQQAIFEARLLIVQSGRNAECVFWHGFGDWFGDSASAYRIEGSYCLHG